MNLMLGYNKNNNSYKSYGAKGIIVCKEWLDDFTNFYNWAVEHNYSDDKVIYLKPNCNEFSSDNCLWVNKSEFAKLNNHNAKYITYNNETHSIREWAEIIGTKYATLTDALRKKTFEEAFLFYTQKYKGGINYE